MVRLWRCEICGDAYIGDDAPSNCPFCGVKKEHIKEFRDAVVSHDLTLSEKDRDYAKKALTLEESNASFYFCAAEKVDNAEGKKLFKRLAKVEAEHASVWKKVLKTREASQAEDQCSADYVQDLKDSHQREERAIGFYRKAAEEADDEKMREIFSAFVEVEEDHLALSEERLG